MAKITSTAEEIAKYYGKNKEMRLRPGSWLTCCPAHQDNKPSMTVTDGRKDILFNCHAGCDTKDIMNIVRAEMGTDNPEAIKREKPLSPKKAEKPLFQWLDEGLKTIPEIPPEVLRKIGGHVTDKWPWHNPKGEIIRWMFRIQKDDGDKTYMPMSVWLSPKEKEKIWRLADTEKRYPYNIHLDDGKKTILHVEGEKCVNKAREIFGDNLFHTTTIGASNSKCDLSSFENRNVMVLCDMDSSGYNIGARLSKIPGIKLWVITPTESMLPTELGFDICNMTENEEDEFKYHMLKRSPFLFHRVV